MSERLQEYFPVVLTLEESTDERWKGYKKAKGIFGECDKPTKNGRAYPRTIIEREIGKLRPVMERRALYGELDHPTDGRTKLERASHIITKLEIDDQGRVIGEAIIMKTPRGQILEQILEAGGEVGVSSRGRGNVKSNGKYEEVADDFVLTTYDFVGDPAMPTAIPNVSESIDDEGLTPEIVAANYPGLYEQIEKTIASRVLSEDNDSFKIAAESFLSKALGQNETRIREELEGKFANALKTSMVDIRESVTQSIKNELMESPEYGGVKSLLSRIHEMTSVFFERDERAENDAVEKMEKTVEDLESSNEILSDKLRESTYLLYAERQIARHPLYETAQSLLSDVKKCSSLDEVKARVSTVLSDLSDIAEERSRAEDSKFETKIAALEKDNKFLEEAIELAESKIESLKVKLEDTRKSGHEIAKQAVEAIEEAKTLRLRLESSELDSYRTKKIANYSNTKDLFALTENADSEIEIDKVVAKYGSTVVKKNKETLEELQSRLRKGRNHADSDVLTENESIAPNRGRKSSLFGADMSEILEIAGAGK